MTRVDFYVLPDAGTDKDRFICRVVDKAYRAGHRVYILTADEAQARALDELLWTFRPGSFVPHDVHSGQDDRERDTPVLIGHQEPPAHHHDVLISLWREVPTFFCRFERLIECVGADEDDKTQSRTRFRFYRDRGYPLETHQV